MEIIPIEFVFEVCDIETKVLKKYQNKTNMSVFLQSTLSYNKKKHFLSLTTFN